MCYDGAMLEVQEKTAQTGDLHHRYHELLFNYWKDLSKGRQYPKESEIDPNALGEIWNSCFLISNDDVTRRIGYRYSFLGSDLLGAFGDDITDHDVALRLLSTARVPNARKFDEVITDKHAVFDESIFVNLMGMNVRYRACLLPLGVDDDVTHIIGCMRWRAF